MRHSVQSFPVSHSFSMRKLIHAHFASNTANITSSWQLCKYGGANEKGFFGSSHAIVRTQFARSKEEDCTHMNTVVDLSAGGRSSTGGDGAASECMRCDLCLTTTERFRTQKVWCNAKPLRVFSGMKFSGTKLPTKFISFHHQKADDQIRPFTVKHSRRRINACNYRA